MTEIDFETMTRAEIDALIERINAALEVHRAEDEAYAAEIAAGLEEVRKANEGTEWDWSLPLNQ